MMINSEVQLKAFLDEKFEQCKQLPPDAFRQRAELLTDVHATIIETFDSPLSSDDLKRYATSCVLVVSEMTASIHEALALAMLARFPSDVQKQMIEQTRKIVTEQMKALGGI